MNSLTYILNLYRIGLIIQERQLRMWVDALMPGSMCIGGNPPLFVPGQTFEGMTDECERGISEAMRAGL